MAGALMCRRRTALAVVCALAFATASVPSAGAQGPDTTEPIFGLAHVDLMDLHVERPVDGPPRDREALLPADLADRFAQASTVARIDRWSLYWDMIERSPSRWDWAAADGIVARDVAAGLDTLLILQGVPAHQATANAAARAFDALTPRTGGSPSRFAPDRLLGPVRPLAPPPLALDAAVFARRGGGLTDDPAEAERANSANPWAVFVERAVERYRPGGALSEQRGWPDGYGVRRWEIGNEPNLAFFWGGTPEQFVRYLEVAYLVIRFHDPGAVIVHGGIADDASAGPWFERFLAGLAARAASSPLPARYGWYFDASAWHWYSYPDLLRTGPAKARALLGARGLNKPIWVTELGVPVWSEHPGPCWDPRSAWRATAAEQSGYVWQAATEATAAALQMLIFFQAYDDCGNGPASYDAFGLRRNHASNQCWAPRGDACWRRDTSLDGTARPAWHALATARDELTGASLLWRPAREAAGWQRVLFFRPPDLRVMVLWNHTRAAQTVEVFGTGPAARVLSPLADGRIGEVAVAPVGGRLTLELPAVTNLNNPGGGTLMAGHPIIVVERDTAAPFRALVDSLAAESPADIMLSVRAADGGTGVARVQLLVAAGDDEPLRWTAAGPEREWSADPLAGTVAMVYQGVAGARYRFAVRAADRAGNWTALPAEAQAETRVQGGAPPTSSATSGPSQTPAPTGTPTLTPTPSSTSTPTATPTPTATIDVVARVHLPACLALYGPAEER